MTAEQRADFVRAFCDGRVWTHLDCDSPDTMRMAFMPLAFMSRDDFPPVETIGLVWAEVGKDRACGAINGIPIFFACRFMHADDLLLCREAAIAEQARRDALRVPDDSPPSDPGAVAAWESEGAAK